MNRFCRAGASLALALGAASVMAQEPASPLTADRLVAQVLADNPGLRGRRAATEAFASTARVAGALDDPKLSLGLAPNTFGAAVNGRGLLQVSQTLPWPGKRARRSAVAQADAAAAGARHDALARELTATARHLWAQWWYVHEALALTDAQRELVTDQVPVAQAHYAAGIGHQNDLLGIQTRVLHLDHQRLQLERRRHEVRARINALRGQSADAPVAAPALPPAVTQLASAAELRAALVRAHPVLAEQDARLRMTGARAALARLDARPDFRVYSGYVGTLDPAAKRWQVGAEINLPFGQNKRRAAIDALEHREAQLRAERDALAVTLVAELEAALAQIDYTDRTLALYRDQIVPLAEQSLAAGRSDFAAARGPYAAVIAAETQLVDARLTMASLRADRLMAVADIDALTAAPAFYAEQEQ